MKPVARLTSGSIVLGLLSLAAACTDDSDRKSEVLVLAAASLTDVFEQLETDFEAEHPTIDVQFSFGASNSLRVQIEQGAPADVVAVADTATINSLVVGGQVRPPIVFASNSMTIAVPLGNPGNVTTITDFTKEELLLGACAPQVPCGSYAGQVFADAGIDPALDTTEPDVRSLVSKVAQGELDAGLVYATDVIATAGKLEEVDLGDNAGVRAEYPIALLPEAGEAAAMFVDFVLSERGRQILLDAGFGPP